METGKIGTTPGHSLEGRPVSSILWYGEVDPAEYPHKFIVIPSIRAFSMVQYSEHPRRPWGFEVSIEGYGDIVFSYESEDSAVGRWKELLSTVENYWRNRKG